MKAKLYFPMLITSIFILMCTRNVEKNCIYVDMSNEHDKSNFMPEKGDSVFIKVYFDNKKYKILPMLDINNDWIYSIPIRKVTKLFTEPVDTLKFTFKIKPGSLRYLSNKGEEIISTEKFSSMTFMNTNRSLFLIKPTQD